MTRAARRVSISAPMQGNVGWVDIELLVPVAVAVVVGGRRRTNRRMMTRHIRDVKGEVNKLPHTSRVRDLMTHKGRSVTTVTMSAS